MSDRKGATLDKKREGALLASTQSHPPHGDEEDSSRDEKASPKPTQKIAGDPALASSTPAGRVTSASASAADDPSAATAPGQTQSENMESFGAFCFQVNLHTSLAFGVPFNKTVPQ
eukprot:m.366480 g.366480  ORF g.366480 m.366480 type:complete len:116 (-) comp56069_c0_seq3:233-580(-)